MALNESKACGLHCIKIKNFAVKIGDTKILENINMHIHCGCITAVIGKNGAGKSTLMRAILGEIPHEGRIEFKDMRDDRFQKLKIGYVPQHLNLGENTPTSVYDLFASFITRWPIFLFQKKRVYQAIKKHLAVFEGEHLIDKTVSELSGGELQRVLLSIATMPVPNLLILDEPVSGIDNNGMELFYKIINKLKKNYDLAIILVSHDLEYVSKYADHVVLLDQTILSEGTAEEVYRSPAFKKVFGNIAFREGRNE